MQKTVKLLAQIYLLLLLLTDIPVTGYEINKEWWQSRYCNPQFIPLHFVDTASKTKNNIPLDSNCALLFCYFNDGDAFIDYINRYSGDLVFVIGPGEGRGTHTNPAPFTANFGDQMWTLVDFQEVKNTKDFIAVYGRS